MKKSTKPKALWVSAFPKQVPPEVMRKARYERKARAWKRNHPECEACPRLGRKPSKTRDVHHLAGRTGDLLLDDTKWLAVCRNCHTWIHQNIEASRKLGLLSPRGQWGKQ